MAQLSPTDFGTTTHRSHVLQKSQCNTFHRSHFWMCFQSKPLENPTRCHRFQTMTLENRFYCIFTAMTVFSATTLEDPFFVFSVQSLLETHVLCSVFKYNDVRKPPPFAAFPVPCCLIIPCFASFAAQRLFNIQCSNSQKPHALQLFQCKDV